MSRSQQPNDNEHGNRRPSLQERLRPGAAIRNKTEKAFKELKDIKEEFDRQARPRPDDPVKLGNHEAYDKCIFDWSERYFERAKKAEKQLSAPKKLMGGDAVSKVWTEPYEEIQKARNQRKSASDEALQRRKNLIHVKHLFSHSRKKQNENRPQAYLNNIEIQERQRLIIG
ncbi:hypothetical protein M422DRAFT_55107 [Sphaerobolus stellatus SS14]|uniref:Uncharacterized protein n=1 Tax=Sphaerobolus stellatus (strain SS14) TaxID=990650 RepID=A0A0C9TDP3_SPHS4|nr:hypothetical protein M422DRAFT_55107 [Sphaerobolus stellatus SS14]